MLTSIRLNLGVPGIVDRLINELRENYLSGHAARVSSAVYADLEALWPYFDANYPFILALPRTARIVEIGSGSGSFLSWLKQKGFTNIVGLDISPEEVERANSRGVPLILADSHDYLSNASPGSIDLVIAKAVFEHMEKQVGADLVDLARKALSDEGILVLDVPNMDWLASNHERYMDLTHHIGYTRESMMQMLSLRFDRIDVQGTREAPTSAGSRIRIKFVKPIAIWLIRSFLRIMGEGAANVLFESRGIIAVAAGNKERSSAGVASE